MMPNRPNRNIGSTKGRPLSFVKFEVQQRQQLASERTSLTLFAPAPSTISFVPLTRNLSPADPSPAPSTALGTGEGPLRYRICVPCSKRPPPVRDAFSVALGAQNRLLRYGRDIRCQKQASVVRDAFSEACRAKSSLLPHRTHLQCAKRPPLGGEQT